MAEGGGEGREGEGGRMDRGKEGQGGEEEALSNLSPPPPPPPPPTHTHTQSITCQFRSSSVAESAVKVVITGWGTPAMDSKLAHSVMVGW